MGSSATPAYVGRVTRMWFPGNETARCSAFNQNYGRIGIGDLSREPASIKTVRSEGYVFAMPVEISELRQ